MPLLVHPVIRPLRVHRQTVELAREPRREVADVDHLLHLALSFDEDLSHFEGDERAEGRLAFAEPPAELPYDLAAPRGRHRSPGEVGLESPAGDPVVFRFVDLRHRGQARAVGGRAHVQR